MIQDLPIDLLLYICEYLKHKDSISLLQVSVSLIKSALKVTSFVADVSSDLRMLERKGLLGAISSSYSKVQTIAVDNYF